MTKFALKISMGFAAVVLLGVVLLSGISTLILGHFDPKLSRGRLEAFEFEIALGVLLILGAIVPTFLAALAGRKTISKSPAAFTLTAAIVVLLLFGFKAFLPVAEWLEPFASRNILYPIVVAMILGVASALAGLTLSSIINYSARPN
jgi:hypothetical protein